MTRRILAVLAVLAALLLPAPAHAAPGDEFRWAVQPSSATGPTGRVSFDYTAPPGQQIADYVGITNLSPAPLTLKVYATDALTSADGSFGLLPAVQPPRDLGSWTDLAPQEYVVPVGKRLDIPFHLTAPANATPGDHAGGIVASISEVKTNAEGKRVNVDRRIAARIYLRVAGPVRPGAQVSAVTLGYDSPANPFSGGKLTVTFRLRNTGNIRVAGTAKIRVRGPIGLDLGSSDTITVPELLPGAEIAVTRALTGIAPAGRISAAVTFNPTSADGVLPTATRTESAWAPPWTILAIVAVLVLAVVLIRWRLRRNRRLDARLAATPGG